MAASVLVGTCVGAGEPEIAYARAKRLVYLCSGVIFCVMLTVMLVRKPILTVMGLSGDSYDAAQVFLLIYFVASIIRMGNWLQNDTYRASGDAIYGTVLEIVFMYVMVLPLVLYLRYCYMTDYQEQGRYLLPALVPAMYYVAKGLERLGRKVPLCAGVILVLCAFWQVFAVALPAYL